MPSLSPLKLDEETEHPQGTTPQGTTGHSVLASSGTHCGQPQWACRPPHCRGRSTTHPRCTAASAPAHTAVYSGVPPLPRQDAGKGDSVSAQRPCPRTLGPFTKTPPPRSRWALCPWSPPHHHLFLIFLFNRDFFLQAACLPFHTPPTPHQHQAQHNLQPQLVLIRAWGRGNRCLFRPQSLFLKGSLQPDTRSCGRCVGLLTPGHLGCCSGMAQGQ